jgi:hypothetical protein
MSTKKVLSRRANPRRQQPMTLVRVGLLSHLLSKYSGSVVRGTRVCGHAWRSTHVYLAETRSQDKGKGCPHRLQIDRWLWSAPPP